MADEALISDGGPYLDAADRAAIEAAVTSGAIAAGPDIASFEADLASTVKVGGAVAVSSGFAALHVCLAALGIARGDDVIVPCVSTCAAIRNAVLAVGARPIFADTNRLDFSLSAASVAKRMTPCTRAIIAPHHTGIPADIDALRAFGVPAASVMKPGLPTAS